MTSSGSGCFEDQWEGIDAYGKIALAKRSICVIFDKPKLTKANGAETVVLINQTLGDSTSSVTLSAENTDLLVPVGVIRYAVGFEWQERLAKNEILEVTLLVDSLHDTRETWNIIFDAREGDIDIVVMLGAHLDSDQPGAGINDDRSSTAAILEIAKSLTKYKGYPNQVRFAWWGAEEQGSGLIGSLHYGAQLTSEEADKIRFSFNYDMVGSPNPIYSMYANNDADRTGSEILVNWLQKKGKEADYSELGSSSDYVTLLELGPPSSRIFTGAGDLTDPCFVINNISWSAISCNAKVAGRAAAQFVLSLNGVPQRS